MAELLSLNLEEYFCSYENEIYRIVEGQHFIATRKLVDNDEEQAILEEILDQSKPPVSTRNSHGQLHYLLYTPFRYPPLKSGGRFHTRLEQSIFYGSESLPTSMAEIAYGRFLFMQHTAARFPSMQVPYTHFVAKVKSGKSVLLTHKPFDVEESRISSATSYAYSQALGASMRKAGVELFSYFSARARRSINIGLFSQEAFKANKPVAGKEKHWSVFISPETIEFQRPHINDNRKETHVFAAQDFFVGGKFPVIL